MSNGSRVRGLRQRAGGVRLAPICTSLQLPTPSPDDDAQRVVRIVVSVWLAVMLPVEAVHLAELGALVAPVVVAQGAVICALLGVRSPRSS